MLNDIEFILTIKVIEDIIFQYNTHSWCGWSHITHFYNKIYRVLFVKILLPSRDKVYHFIGEESSSSVIIFHLGNSLSKTKLIVNTIDYYIYPVEF